MAETYESLTDEIAARKARYDFVTEAVQAAPTFYVLSLTHTHRRDGLITWWGPDDSDYYFRLELSGAYTREQIERRHDYYNNGETTLAIPRAVVDAVAVSVGEIMLLPKGARARRALDDRDHAERVVAHELFARLRRHRHPRAADAQMGA